MTLFSEMDEPDQAPAETLIRISWEKQNRSALFPMLAPCHSGAPRLDRPDFGRDLLCKDSLPAKWAHQRLADLEIGKP